MMTIIVFVLDLIEAKINYLRQHLGLFGSLADSLLITFSLNLQHWRWWPLTKTLDIKVGKFAAGCKWYFRLAFVGGWVYMYMYEQYTVCNWWFIWPQKNCATHSHAMLAFSLFHSLPSPKSRAKSQVKKSKEKFITETALNAFNFTVQRKTSKSTPKSLFGNKENLNRKFDI